MQIISVQTTKDLNRFLELPYRIYRQDPMWVPPLRSEQRSQFDRKRNPMLDHCEWGLFLLEDQGQIVGRIAALIDRLALEAWNEPIGLFGYYECPNDPQASRMLLDAARDWLLTRGMKAMRGPWTFISQEWGMVLDGFAPPPTIMAPYNPPFYNEQMCAYGLEKVKDLVCYAISAKEGYQIPERILKLTDTVARRIKVHVRQVDMRRFDQEVALIQELSNNSIIDNWGYSPVTEAEVRAMAHDMKQIVQPKGVLFAEDEFNRPIGFAIALPDVNVLLKGLNGHMLPLGWLKLLWGLPRLQCYRMFALGVIPEYHGRGVDSLIYRALYESLYTPDLWMEINYVLEDNGPMNNAILKLGARSLRRYRIYQKNI